MAGWSAVVHLSCTEKVPKRLHILGLSHLNREGVNFEWLTKMLLSAQYEKISCAILLEKAKKAFKRANRRFCVDLFFLR